MSDERKAQRPLDPDFPGEERLSHLYREGSGELPPANLDAVILDAARQAVHSRPRRIYFFPSRKWVVPLSLAAALWVTFEIVTMRRTELTSYRLNAPSAPMPPPESFSLEPQRTERLTDAPPPLVMAPTPREENMVVRDRSAQLQKKEAPQEQDRERNTPETETRRGIAPASPTRRLQATKSPVHQMLPGEREKAEEKTDTAADTAGLQADTA